MADIPSATDNWVPIQILQDKVQTTVVTVSRINSGARDLVNSENTSEVRRRAIHPEAPLDKRSQTRGIMARTIPARPVNTIGATVVALVIVPKIRNPLVMPSVFRQILEALVPMMLDSNANWRRVSSEPLSLFQAYNKIGHLERFPIRPEKGPILSCLVITATPQFPSMNGVLGKRILDLPDFPLTSASPQKLHTMACKHSLYILGLKDLWTRSAPFMWGVFYTTI